MFFADHEKQIYSPPGSDLKFDPLALDRALTLASEGRLNDLLGQWCPGEGGDVSQGAPARSAVASAEAEAELVAVARKAFQLPAFPDCPDALALEHLCDFLWWMEKKGVRGETPPPSPSTSDSPAG